MRTHRQRIATRAFTHSVVDPALMAIEEMLREINPDHLNDTTMITITPPNPDGEDVVTIRITSVSPDERQRPPEDPFGEDG